MVKRTMIEHVSRAVTAALQLACARLHVCAHRLTAREQRAQLHAASVRETVVDTFVLQCVTRVPGRLHNAYDGVTCVVLMHVSVVETYQC